MRKRRILVHSNFCRAFTGFGKHKKNLLRYLFDRDKYEIIEFANGVFWDEPKTHTTPWKTYGSLPRDKALLAQISQDPQAQRQAGYGYFGVDQAIRELKPDIYLGIEDIWGLELWEKPWWKVLTPMIWTTLDSLPILESAWKGAEKTENFLVWASFAEKAMKERCPNVKTLHGTLDTDTFFPLEEERKRGLRRKNGIADNEFVIGFVFRNQLRKTVPNLLDGFMAFRKQEPRSNAKLLLHTHWSEGWDIPRLMQERDIPPQLVLTTYFCPKCNQYFVKPFQGQELNCSCGAQKSQNTTNIGQGVTEVQLNEIYNMMDVYCHPFTSGGQEIPVQEAKLTELITLVTNYSCGEDHCTPESGGFPLEWAEYHEPGTQFIKASTRPFSIAKQLKKVFNMSPSKRKQIGRKARQFVINNYSIESVAKDLEEILDAAPILDEKVWEDFESKLDQERPPRIDDFLDEDDDGKRILIAMPQGLPDVLMINSLLTNLKEAYPDYNIYFATESYFFGAIDSHPAIHKVIPFHPTFNSSLAVEGSSERDGVFEIVFTPHVTTQLTPCYTHNAQDKITFDLWPTK
jgi:glycosyltransferase involved in cell wall biosynthesis